MSVPIKYVLQQGPVLRGMGEAIVGALMDFPELSDDPDVMEALDVLDGDLALAAGAVRQAHGTEMGLNADEFLAQFPGSIHAFAAGRLASPVFETVDAARVELLKNAGKLRRLSLSRENAATVIELQRVASLGDEEREMALLRDAERRKRAKLGLA